MATEDAGRSPDVQRKIWGLVLLICYTFIVSGGANIGFSKFLMALPFMPLALSISKNVLKAAIYKKTTFLIIAFAISLSVTLTQNPIAFPTLHDGYVEVISDGFHVTYGDGSGGFYHEKLDEESGFDDVTYKALERGEKYKVTGVKITHPGFSTQINLQTTIGQFYQLDYQGASFLKLVLVPIKKFMLAG